MNYEPCQIKAVMWKIEKQEPLDIWGREMVISLMGRAIPVKPTGHEGYMRCGVCGTRIRSRLPHSAKDTVCRKCFTVIDWTED